MAGITLTNFDPALKQLYRDSNIENLTFKDNVLFGILKKFEGMGGRNMPIVMQYQNPQGRSMNFTRALALSNTSANGSVGMQDVLLTWVSDHQVATLSNEVLEATKGDAMSFLQALKAKMDGALRTLASSLEEKLYRNRSSFKCQLSATVAETAANPMVVTLDYPQSTALFEVGMSIVASAGGAGGTANRERGAGAALRATPNPDDVIGVNRTAGTLTIDFDNSGPTCDWGLSDYLYADGDVAATVVSDKLAGLESWLPDSTFAPVSGETYYGADRTSDSRMYGQYYDASALSMEDATVDASSLAAQEGGSPDIFLCHSVQFRRLVKELGSKREYYDVLAQNAKSTLANIGFRAIVIDGEKGPVKVLASIKCPVVRGFCLSMDGWTFNSIGKAPRLNDTDGNKLLRMSSEDSVETRFVYRGNLSCTAPIHNVHVLLPTP